MTRAFVKLARLLLCTGLLLAHTTPPPTAPTPIEDDAAVIAQVRLRKLHLVRPDLIPYPIAYEVCC